MRRHHLVLVAGVHATDRHRGRCDSFTQRMNDTPAIKKTGHNQTLVRTDRRVILYSETGGVLSDVTYPTVRKAKQVMNDTN
jgi:hypothetical protein